MHQEERPSRQQQRCKDTRIVRRNEEESVATKLQRIANKAGTDKRFKFTSLFHLMNKNLLLECFTQLKANAASGIDNITKAQYATDLDANLERLVYHVCIKVVKQSVTD